MGTADTVDCTSVADTDSVADIGCNLAVDIADRLLIISLLIVKIRLSVLLLIVCERCTA